MNEISSPAARCRYNDEAALEFLTSYVGEGCVSAHEKTGERNIGCHKLAYGHGGVCDVVDHLGQCLQLGRE